MNQIRCIGMDEMDGKTVKTVLEGFGCDEILIVFTDGSMIQFYALACDEEVSIETTSFVHPMNFKINELEAAIGEWHPSIIADVRAFEAKEKAERQARNEQQERKDYERLKAKFEPKQPTNMELAT